MQVRIIYQILLNPKQKTKKNIACNQPTKDDCKIYK